MSDAEKKRIFFYYLFVLTILSVVPGGSASEPVPGTDKILHFTFYLVLAVLFFHSELLIKFKKELLIILISSTMFGFFIECIQALIPWRSFEMKDMAANFSGALSGVFIGRFFLKRN
ncbi:MAG: VanZ family protein [Desulfobacteraceae bacterium]